MPGLDLTLHVRPTKNPSNPIEVEAGTAGEAVVNFLNYVGEKTNWHFRIRIDRPFRPRTTGPRSQSARFRGHCEDLAQQIPGEYTAKQIADAMKRMAVADGYRTRLSIDGTEEPVSEAELSMEEESLLLKVQQRYADVHGFWLTEYKDTEHPEQGTYRSVGGRSYAEMQEYNGRRGIFE